MENKKCCESCETRNTVHICPCHLPEQSKEECTPGNCPFHPEAWKQGWGGSDEFWERARKQHERHSLPEKSKECAFESDGEKHSCITGCDGIVENCRKCHKDRCSNTKCPLGKGVSWEVEFDQVRNDGEHCSIDDEALNKFDVIMLKDIIRDLLSQNSHTVRREIEKKFKRIIVEEISTANAEGEKTSRLTSLFNKMKEKLK